MKRIRCLVARGLIRLAIKVCVYGWTQDHLEAALRHEPAWDEALQ